MLLSLGQMFWGSFVICYYVSWCYRTMWVSGGHQTPDVVELLLEFKFWWLDQHLIPYMWQLVLAYISVKGWVIDSNEYCFFDGSGNTLVLPAHSAKSFKRKVMTSGAGGGYGWVRGPSCVLWTFLQKFCLIPQYILHSPPCHTYICRSPHFSGGWCLCPYNVPGGPWWYCLLKVHINAMFPADVLATLTHSLNIGHHYVGIVVVEACVVPSVIGILVGSVGFLLFYACPI